MGCEVMLFGVVGGLVITATALVIQFFFDDKKKSEEKLEKEFAFNKELC